MSDKPLFQNADEQEATYAPDQLPGKQSSEAADDAPPVPPVAGIGSGTQGPIGTAPVVGKEVSDAHGERDDRNRS